MYVPLRSLEMSTTPVTLLVIVEPSLECGTKGPIDCHVRLPRDYSLVNVKGGSTVERVGSIPCGVNLDLVAFVVHTPVDDPWEDVLARVGSNAIGEVHVLLVHQSYAWLEGVKSRIASRGYLGASAYLQSCWAGDK